MTSWLELAGSNKRGTDMPLKDEKKNERKKSAYEDDIKTNVTKYLADQIKFDMELFDFAAELSNRREKIACCINQHL